MAGVPDAPASGRAMQQSLNAYNVTDPGRTSSETSACNAKDRVP